MLTLGSPVGWAQDHEGEPKTTGSARLAHTSDDVEDESTHVRLREPWQSVAVLARVAYSGCHQLAHVQQLRCNRDYHDDRG